MLHHQSVRHFYFMEQWKDIKGFEGLYKISNLGRVKSLKRLDSIGRRVKERILRFKVNRYGYYYAELHNDGKSKSIKIHRLVASAFINNKEGKLEVNHKDGIKANNSLINLEWATRSENMKHAILNKLKVSPQKGKHPLARIVLNTQTGVYYECIKDAAFAAGVEYDTLRARLNGICRNKTSFIYV